MNPQVSICIPTYNPDLKYLQELLASIERQTWSQIEVVISDDSSANFEQMVSMLPTSRFQRSVYRAERRLGMAGNWNYSAERANGRYLIVTGQDDLFADDGVEMLVRAAMRHDVDLVFGGQGYVGPAGEQVRNPSRSVTRETLFRDSETRLPPRSALALALLYGNVLGDPCSTLILRSAFEATSGFSGEYLHAADLEFWMRLAASGCESLSLGKVVAAHRSHSANATSSHVSSGVAQADRLKIHADYGAAIHSDRLWNRSVMRLHMHAIFDQLSHATIPLPGYPSMRGSRVSRMIGITSELAELARLKRPDIARLLQRV